MKIVYTLFAGMMLFVFSTTVFAFTDMQPGDKYSDAVFFLEDLGILEGYADGEVKVNQSVTRAEFLKMVLEYNEEEIGDEMDCFEDVKGDWSEKYVCYAKNKGWVDGYDADHFIPSKEVNFVEAMKIITNVVFYNCVLDEQEENEAWFYRYVDFLDKREVDLCEVNSYGEVLTRGMIAELLYKVELSKEATTWGDLHEWKCIEVGESYEDLGMGFFKYRGDVYFYTSSGPKRLYIADFDSFERFHEHYGRDKNNVYLRVDIVEGADPNSFEILHYVYGRDRAYAVDSDSVYYGIDLLEGLYVNSFEVINSEYIKDINGVYCQDNWGDNPLEKIQGADPDTFVLIGEGVARFGKDKDNVYYGTTLVEMADSETVKFLGGDYSNGYYANQYAKDDNYVYCGDDIASETSDVNILEGADPDTFEIVSTGDYRSEVRDGDKVYENCEIVE